MTETTQDRAVRLALDLGRAKRRIAELEAAEAHVRALSEKWIDEAEPATNDLGPTLQAVFDARANCGDEILDALDGPSDGAA
jgi:hypothetical protein